MALDSYGTFEYCSISLCLQLYQIKLPSLYMAFTLPRANPFNLLIPTSKGSIHVFQLPFQCDPTTELSYSCCFHRTPEGNSMMSELVPA